MTRCVGVGVIMMDLYIDVKIRPKSGRFCIKKDHDKKTYVINLKSVPENNKANIELIKELSRLLKREVLLVKGHKSKNKTLMIKDMTLEEFDKLL